MNKPLASYKKRGRKPSVTKPIDQFDAESLEKLNELKEFRMSIKTLSNHHSSQRLQLDPPYQRRSVWPLAYKQELIQCIMKDIPIPTIFWVAQKKELSVQNPEQTYSVLDGKQRTKAILEYWNNEFPVVIDGLCAQPLYKKDLDNSTDPKAKVYLDKLSDKSLSISCFPWMKLENQRNIFMVLNHSVPVSPNEKVYCDNFLVKTFMSDIWDESFKDYAIFAPKIKGKKVQKIMENGIYSRYDNLRYVHSILMKLFGLRLEEGASNPMHCCRPISKDKIKESAAKLETSLRAIGYTDGSETTDEVIDQLHIVKQKQIFMSVTSALRSAFEYGPLPSKWEKNIVRDVTLLFVFLAFENEFTPSQIREQSKILHEVFTEYSDWVSNETAKEVKSESLNAKVIKTRTSKLYEFFQNKCHKNNVDISVKNKLLTKTEIRQAKLESNGFCPLCERVLTDKNVQIDHVDPKSKFGETRKIAICSECNGRKSNWSPEETKKLDDYFEKYSLQQTGINFSPQKQVNPTVPMTIDTFNGVATA